MSDIIENLTGVSMPSNADADLIKATKGKPTRVFPFLIKDFSLFGYFDVDLYYYTGKHYEPFDDFNINRLVRKFYLDNNLSDKYNLSKARELKAMIKYEPMITRTEFDQYENLVNLNNGIYNYDTKELIPHDHSYKFTYLLNVNYDPAQTECPTFLKFIHGCFASKGDWENDYEYDKDAVENIIRLCGYLLYPKNRIEGIFILLGGGSNGKSVLMDVLRMFFPVKYVTNLSLNAISNEEGFTREKLLKSWVNFCSEQKGGKINSEELKKVASGEGLSIQRKHATAIDFISRTKICVNTNNMPYFNDTSMGILRRLYIFHFKNQFLKIKDYNKVEKPEENGVFKQLDKAWLLAEIKKEKEAIFNLFLGGLERLKNNGWDFQESKNMKDILEEYKEGADILSAWLSERYTRGDDETDFIAVNIIYERFKRWYEDNYSKKCGFSSISLGKKIKDKYRFKEAKRQWSKRVDGTLFKATGYPLKEKFEVGAMEELQKITFSDTDIDEDKLL